MQGLALLLLVTALPTQAKMPGTAVAEVTAGQGIDATVAAMAKGIAERALEDLGLAHPGGAETAPRVVSGSITSTDGVFVAVFRLHDRESARDLHRVTMAWHGDAGALAELIAAATELVVLQGSERAFGRVSLQAPEGTSWSVDGQAMAGTEGRLTIGVHEISAATPSGLEEARWIIVRADRTTSVDIGARQLDRLDGHAAGPGGTSGAGLAARPAGVAGSAQTDGPESADRSSFFSLEGEILLPLNDGYGSRRVGYGGALSFWSQHSFLAIQPKWSVDVGPGNAGAYYLNMAWDLGFFVLPLSGEITPIVGGGVGVRYLRVKGTTEEVGVGSVLQTTIRTTPLANRLGWSAFGRAGALFFRGADLQLFIAGDYSAAFFGQDGTAQALVFVVGLTL